MLKVISKYRSAILGYAVIALFALFPLLITAAATTFEYGIGCDVTGGRLDHCTKFGVQWGIALGNAASAFLLCLATVPAAVIIAIFWSFILIFEKKNSNHSKTAYPLPSE